MEREYVIGVTGASGTVYAQRLLEHICPVARVHLVVSATARELARHEGARLDGYRATCYDPADMSAPVASGSFRHQGMAIVPCTMKTLAAVSGGHADNLILRAADVCLKEKRPLILLLREMPLSRVHLKNMLAADEAGATVMVASPAFYHRPRTIDDLVDMVVARVLDHLGVEHALAVRWKGYDA